MRRLTCILLLALAASGLSFGADAFQTTIGSPLPLSDGTTLAVNQPFAINANNDSIEWIVQLPEATTITAIGFLYGVRTGTPPTYRASLQSVNTSGRASGTVLGGGSPASATFTPPADATWNGTYQWVTLTNGYAGARGEVLSIVLDYSSGTVDGSNNSSFVTFARYVTNGAAFPTVHHVDAGVGTRQVSFPAVAWKSASKTYGWPVVSFNSTALNSGTTPDEQAISFNVPSTWWSTYKVVGVEFKARANASGTTLKVALYTGTTELQNITVDLDLANTGTSTNVWRVYFDEESLSTLNAGSTYRVGFAPQEVGASFFIQTMTTAAASDASAWPGGSVFAYSTRTDGGAWTDDATSRPLANLILSDITAPAGGGASAHTWVQ